MSYSTENEKDSVRRDMLVILKPRMRLEDWEGYIAGTYAHAFPYHGRGKIVGVSVNGSALTLGSGTDSLSAGQWFHYQTNDYLYLRKSDSSAPAASDWIVVTFELYLATTETYWYRVPTDASTEQVLFRGIITDAPAISRSSQDAIFGFSPVDSTEVVCLNDAEYFQPFLHNFTMNECEVVIYHVAGDLSTANIQKLFTGVGGDVAFDDREITFSILDKTRKFDKKMTNDGDATEYPDSSGTDGAGCDPRDSRKVVRSFYGQIKGVRAINTLYADDSPTTSQNRRWVVGTSAFGNYTINQVYLIQGGVTAYPLTVTTHYSTGSSSDHFYITLVNNVESSIGSSTINPESDFVVVYFDGPNITPTLGGSPVGDFENPISILYHVLVTRMGLATSEINEASFIAAAPLAPVVASVMIPGSEHAEMPTYREVITRLLATALCRAYFDADGKFTVKKIGPASGSPDYELTDEELLSASFEYSYSDLAKVYSYNDEIEYSLRRSKADILAGTAGPCTFAANDFLTRGQYDYEGNQYLHQTSRTISIDNYCGVYTTPEGGNEGDAFAELLAQVLGERRGRLSCFISVGAHGLEIGSTVSVDRAKLPGFEYTEGTTHTRNMIVADIRKELTGVFVVLEDQKGIEDNSGDW